MPASALWRWDIEVIKRALNTQLHILKRNKPVAVALSEEDDARLTRNKIDLPADGMSAVQRLLSMHLPQTAPSRSSAR